MLIGEPAFLRYSIHGRGPEWKNMSNNIGTRDESMPYERFLKYGAKALTNTELLAILIRTGTRGEGALDLAARILNYSYQERESGKKNAHPVTDTGKNRLSILHELSLQDLMSISGIGEVKAVRLLCVAEIALRMAQEKTSSSLSFTSPGSVAEYYMESMRHEPQEHVLLILLDSHLHLIADEILSVGTANRSYLCPRDVFRLALRSKATNLMLMHNHPSGDPTPSKDDIATTQRIHQLGEELEVRLVDHIVIGDNRYVSLKECGLI